jgi:AraC family transcriptional regulator
VESAAIADYPAGARMGPRRIVDWEFVWMLRGQSTFVADEENITLTPGSLLLIPPGARHSFVWDQRQPSRHGYVHFGPEHPGAARDIAARVRRMTENDPMSGLCAYLIWLGREQRSGWREEANRALDFLIYLFESRHLPGDNSNKPLPIPLQAIVDHLRNEWSQLRLRRIQLSELASASGVSLSYLNRLFSKEFGTSCSAALELLRVSRAETLLTRTDMMIASIARQCGFADPFHFSHRFMRHSGVSPSVYRRAAPAPASVLDDHPGVRRLAQAVWGPE